MTFTEAAEAVLRKAGKPLHFKKITQFAIDQNLLSHVGKTPETTMSTRLATLTKKDRGDQNIVRVKPGVFGLREWGGAVEAAADESEGSEVEVAEVEAAAPAPTPAPAPAPVASLPPSPRPEAQGGREGREGRGRDQRGRDGRREGRPSEGRPAEGRAGEGRPSEGRSSEGRSGEGRSGEGRTSLKPPPVPFVAPPSAAAPAEGAAEARGEGRRRERDRGRGRDRNRDRAPQGEPAVAAEPVVAAPVVAAPVVAAPVVEPAAVEPVAVESVAAVTAEYPEVAEVAAVVEAVTLATPAPHAEAAEEIAPSEAVATHPGPARVSEEVEEPVEMAADERDRNQRFAAAQEMFPEEDDDEEPLLGGDDKSDGGRRRRRRRRRGRAEGGVEAADGGDVAVVEVRDVRDVRPEVRPEARGERSERDRGDRSERGDRGERGDRDRDRGDRDRDRGERREERDRSEGSEELGRDTADIVVSLLTRRDDRQPVAIRHLVDDAVRAGKLSGDATVLAASVAAAVRVDGVRRAARGERARMRLAGGRVGLVDWTLPPELLRAEAEAFAAIERLREQSRRYVVRRLNELPPSSFVEVAALLLERLGMSNLRVSRRPGLPQGEVHLSCIARRGPEEMPLAVVLKRGGEVGRERVIEMRGSLHHYGAQGVWIVTTGNVFSGARDEAAAAGAAPVTLVDGAALGRLLDEHAVLVQHATVSLPSLDVDLYDALRSV